jgi:hypothetical protein
MNDTLLYSYTLQWITAEQALNFYSAIQIRNVGKIKAG